MTTVAPITTHVEDADALFIDQYKDKPRLSAWLASYVARVQEFEDAAWQVIVLRNVDVATGAQLDSLGQLVGQPRYGLPDDRYRIRIKTRILSNTSLGRPDDLIEIAELTGATDVTYSELYPASWVIDALGVVDPATFDPTFTGDILRASDPAGVTGQLHYSADPESETFAFSMSDVEEADAARGFSDDDGITGGKLIGVS